MLATEQDGRVHWDFPRPYGAPPAVSATPVDPDPADDRTVSAVLEEVTSAGMTARVWRTQPLTDPGLPPSLPAGPGVLVHLLAVPVGE